jgi:hypothetical protein
MSGTAILSRANYANLGRVFVISKKMGY